MAESTNEYMNESEFQRWIQAHGGERGREPFYANEPITDLRGAVTGTKRTMTGTKVVARDGATITVVRTPNSGTPGEPDYQVESRLDPPPDAASQRTPEQTRQAEATARKTETDTAAAELERDERWWNQNQVAQGGSGIPETHQERATREAKIKQDERAQQEKADAQRRQDAIDAQRNRETAADRAERERASKESAAVQREQLEETRRQNEYTRNKPDFLPGDTKSPNITVWNPATGKMEALQNPNYDAVKAAAEERRLELASQVQSGQLQLEAAKQQYTQWFDTNVKTPLMLSQEARAKAEERRQALEAEERRRQFAADFGLRKATLGQQAGEAAANQEISLLPYRSGPTWGADISDAINSLAGGGNLANNASAGIHFSDSSFAFKRPDFKQIAKDAAKAALSGLTDYRPSDQEFETGDYSGVPAVNLGGAPAPYSFQGSGAALPPPSPEYTQ